ncbi:polyprenyl synthetase family protein [Schleiferilactobacillus shenzhenensis]|uniref:Heptaprenyl diphosphate synthase n=1 Tax=Schleiferilactobacillus shenzhenensis LY-73 TaxID=1231336 RepID=U4TQV6_9LACO|nr:polyprenyl synthetase family protein [Schleiferilactobacillus shenzhenensis]ERL66614.1 heptaprenyl diphosphate synthase [Schleiferilactobacillus shenzhenensis LY-73]
MKSKQTTGPVDFSLIAADLTAVQEILSAQRLAVPHYAADYQTALATSGKMWRAALTILFARLAQPAAREVPPSVTTGAAAIEMLHLATLMHDDVLDNAPVRRHQPTLQMKHGNHAAIYLGDELLARYFRFITDIAPDLAFTNYHARVMQQILTGELQQAAEAYDTTATVPAYIETVRGKTGALFGLAAKTGAWLADGFAASRDTATVFGENLGITFQILDDLNDFRLQQDSGKPKLSDLASGIYTLPLRLGMAQYPALAVLLQAGAPASEILTFLHTRPNILAATAAMGREYLVKARTALDQWPVSAARQPLSQMLDYLAAALQTADI